MELFNSSRLLEHRLLLLYQLLYSCVIFHHKIGGNYSESEQIVSSHHYLKSAPLTVADLGLPGSHLTKLSLIFHGELSALGGGPEHNSLPRYWEGRLSSNTRDLRTVLSLSISLHPKYVFLSLCLYLQLLHRHWLRQFSGSPGKL